MIDGDPVIVVGSGSGRCIDVDRLGARGLAGGNGSDRRGAGVLTADDVKTFAREAGFDLCGIAPAEDFPELRFLDEWIDRGYAGEMRYLARTARRRSDVRQVVRSARSVVSLGTLYNTDRPYSTEVNDPDAALISRYAWGEDYHDVVGRRTEALLARMRAAAGEPFEARCYVDTGPVQERVYAQHAGLGWIGKNTCLINPEQGSWFFLSEIITSLPLEPGAPQLDQCGTCTLCIEACPTDALREPWVLDAARCLSYLTIEIRGAIPEPQRPDVGTHVYGCDICQEVCPYNAEPARSTAPAWQPAPDLDQPRLSELWRRSDERLGALLDRSAMSRARLTGLRRNVAVALGNSSTAAAAAAIAEPESAETPSRGDPMVAEHVEWARRRVAAARSPALTGAPGAASPAGPRHRTSSHAAAPRAQSESPVRGAGSTASSAPRRPAPRPPRPCRS